ncbi:helix-turn-helix transcriptional regulator [Aminithiophilus ramosus]|uniref:Helix-turn-helix transcriptional regulator n=1 Tax=Aminithiophilus ramosus TaxID=3029084 RepID=A0A9Q7AHU7_9BACT|nr:helix-turn-helix transcriptional regulator [Aminithiophilus ramosus]
MISGGEIKALRKSRGLSQQELADATGVSRSAVYLWESGTHPPVGKNLQALARALNVSTAYLMGETDEPRPRNREESFEIQAPSRRT